ncbi:CD1375 family protein [Lactococcus petauri]|nr:CD1375 family protein [Lactococcus petauri]
MARFYATIIKNGSYTLERVPKVWYAEVVEILNHWED